MESQIKCPNCGHEFDVEAALSTEIEAHYRKEFEKKMSESAVAMQKLKGELAKERDKIRAEKDKMDEQIKKALEEKIVEVRKKMEKETREEVEAELKALREDNDKRKAENKKLREKEVALLKMQQELKEKEEEMEIRMQKRILEQQQEIEARVRRKEQEQHALVIKEYEKRLEDQKKLSEEAIRKAKQGNMKTQGEVQELALEELLSAEYPFDRVENVPSGVAGADCIQYVVNTRQQECGSIVYESKRTQAFGGKWIDKIKQDQVACKADIAVIVTQVFPSGMDRFGLVDGVWVCSFHEVRSLSMALRQVLLSTQNVRVAQENKGEKMELLYHYLTSPEFVQTVKRIIENYDNMRMQLEREKRAMTKHWKVREKQIEAVQLNLASLFGSIKGIAGDSLVSSDVLELPGEKE